MYMQIHFYIVLDFFLGMLIASVYLDRKDKIDCFDLKRAEFIIVICFIAMYIVSLKISAKLGYYTILFCFSFYIFAKGEGFVSNLLSSKILGKFAYYSYEFYMVHELVLKTLKTIFVNFEMKHYFIKSFLIVLPSFFISLALAVIFKKIFTELKYFSCKLTGRNV